MSQTSKLILGAATCALSLVSAANESWAFEESDKTQALEHYQEARTNWANHRYCDAATGFDAALSTIPLPLLALWAGHAKTRCGTLVAALNSYTTATRLTANELWVGNKQQLAQAQASKALAALWMRIPKLVIDTTALGDDKEVTVDGEVLPADKRGTEIPVNPGPHVIAYTRGGETRQERVDIQEGNLRVLHLGRATPVDERPAPAAAHVHMGQESADDANAESRPSATPRGPVPAQSERRYKTATIVSAVLGSAGIAAGVVTRLMAFHQKTVIDAHCDQSKRCDQTGMDAVSSASSLQNQSTVYLLIGAAGATTAIGLAIAGASSSNGSLTAMVLPSGAALGFEGGF